MLYLGVTYTPMKTTLQLLILILIAGFFSYNERRLPTAAPIIQLRSFFPGTGSYNSVVAIRGRFNPVDTANRVKFNGFPAIVISADDTLLKVKVPKGAGDGKITVNAFGQTIESTTPFYYNYAISAISELAGNGSADYLNGSGQYAAFNFPRGIVCDTADNIFVADNCNFCIRKITPQGDVSLFAGQPGVQGTRDGTRTEAEFNSPASVSIDSNNNLYVSEYGKQGAIRKVTPAAIVSTVAAGGTSEHDTLTVPLMTFFPFISNPSIDKQGHLYVSSTLNGTISKIDFATGVKTIVGKKGELEYVDGPVNAARLGLISSIAMTGEGELLLADQSANRVRKINLVSGKVSTVVGNGERRSKDTDNSLNASFNCPMFIVQDKKDNIIVAENFLLRMITSTGRVITLKQKNIGAANPFLSISGIALNSKGELLVSDAGDNMIRKVRIE